MEVGRRQGVRALSISVLVTAHQRRHFLPEALRSIGQQTIPRSEYEVVVVKDFDHDESDRQLSDLGGRAIVFESDNMGEIMAAGIRACRGEVVCFLDDDDTFEARKLTVVRDQFLAHPDMGYFHNGLAFMSEGGRSLDDEDPGAKARALRMSESWDFCCSCISVRRELLSPFLSRWPEVTRSPDSFLDSVSRASPYSRHQTLEPLTHYRVHAQSNSRRTNHARAYMSTARILRSMPRSRARDGALSSLLGHYMSAAIRGRSTDRRAAVWAVLQLAASGAPAHFKPDAREVACGALIPFSPRWAQRVYSAIRRGKVDWLPPA